MIDGNKLAEVGFQKIGTPYSEMDCQKFVEWCLKQCGCSKDLAGSNAWYREVMKNGAVMTPEECVAQLGKVPAGAFLFILQQDGKEPEKYKPDGIGNASHIGICTMPKGEGAIHSSASRGCVCESKFAGKTIKNGGWNRVGLWDQVAYDYGGKTPEPEPEPDEWTAEVWAANGRPVNLREKPSKTAARIELIKVGETVDVLEYGETWCRVRWKTKNGYMMTEFLLFSEPEDLYCVTIHDLPKTLAEEIANVYGGSITREG